MKRLLFSVIFLAFLCGKAIFAQSANATLTGVVTDQNGAVIPNATITATNNATNLSRTVSTNNEGVYVLSSLPVGGYEVKITAANFETKTSESEVVLNVGQTVILDAELKIGANIQTVDLIGEIPFN
ncbi:MAG: carboxypeptidase-like regulatory domain-containing protein [Pyrinomonadaceae bacterium]|nr:carboxypeptidase-like regulatory domain-containing protein [Pyrinomonadaceae bacterium]